MCRCRACLRRGRGDRHGECGARPDRPPVSRRRVRAGVAGMGASRTFSCHHPRKRMIRYAAAVVFDHLRRGVLDRPAKPGDDSRGLERAL
nr:hypothetical protein [Bradyrhizobium sediminis]